MRIHSAAGWVVLLAACLAIAILFVMGGANSPELPYTTRAASNQSQSSQHQTASPDFESSVAKSRTAVTGGRLLVIDANSRQPIASATLSLAHDLSLSTIASDDTSIASAGSDGMIRIPAGSRTESTYLVRDPAHVPALLTCLQYDHVTVALEPAASVEVAVIDAVGRPVPDARVVLSTSGLDGPTGTQEVPLEGIGGPLSHNPLWISQCSPTGLAIIHELPKGRYFLTVLSDARCPTGPLGDRSPLVVDGIVRLTVALQDMYGVAFAIPEGGDVIHVAWNINSYAIDRSPRVLRRLAAARAYLEDRFPRSLVFVHIPTRTDFQVECRAGLKGGTFWKGRWPLAPVREILDPIFLEQESVGGVQRVVLRVVDDNGTVFPGLQFRVRHGESKYLCSVVTDEEVLLPYGHYSVHPLVVSSWTYSSFQHAEFNVDTTSPSPTVVELHIHGSFASVEIRPTDIVDEPTGPLTISLDDEGGGGHVVANWTPKRGPILEIVPIGTLRVSVTGAMYEPASVQRRIVSSTATDVVEVPLTRIAPHK